MDAYVYQAALWCDDCIKGVKEDLAKEAGKSVDEMEEEMSDETQYDSNDYPKGPYDDGGGEADTPQHCDGCKAFLENPLTSEGMEYAQEAFIEALNADKDPDTTPSIAEWGPFYDLDDPKDRLTVKVEDQDDDPFTVMFTVQGGNADHWADANGAIAGGTWETADGRDFVYDSGGLYPGCFEEWQADGWDLDLSEASEDPLDVFRGLDEKELQEAFNSYTTIGLHEDKELQNHIRKQLKDEGADIEDAQNPKQLKLFEGRALAARLVKMAKQLMEDDKK